MSPSPKACIGYISYGDWENDENLHTGSFQVSANMTKKVRIVVSLVS